MKELGIKDGYLFGGTASAYGHYVLSDLQREKGIKNLQKDRFDYAYESIFRSNQDFDFVIDGTAEQAKELERRLVQEFEYFIGNKSQSVWEVRLLRDSIGDKSAILDDYDMMNQHTDSFSTGLINIGECEGLDCVKDFRDWKSKESNFLKDLANEEITYYYSNNHKNTLRFDEGKNPEIFSVVRYYTKAVQYELKMKQVDIDVLQKILNDFDPNENFKDSYSDRWVEKNAKKLIQNAIDIEYAWNLIESTGLRKKLIAINNNPEVENSMAYWLSKEPLRTRELGKDGVKAKDLLKEYINKDGDIIISHETNNFDAYESILKSHDGMPNFLISREGVAGEGAAFGEGAYTKIGKEGARGTGITIRMKLNPEAVEGVDFKYIKRAKFVILLNKKAATVIVESLNLSALEYFKMLAEGLEFDFSDQAVVNKLRKKVLKSSNVSENDLVKILDLVKENVNSSKVSTGLLAEWFFLSESRKHPYILKKIILLRNEKFNEYIAENVLSKSGWENQGDLVELLIKNGGKGVRRYVARYILSQNWATYEESMKILIKDKNLWVRLYLTRYALSEKQWSGNTDFIKTLLKDKNSKIRRYVAQFILSKDYWKGHPELVEILIKDKSPKVRNYVAQYVLSQKHWEKNPELVVALIQSGGKQLREYIKKYVLIQDFWKDNLEFQKLIKENSGLDDFILSCKKFLEGL